MSITVPRIGLKPDMQEIYENPIFNKKYFHFIPLATNQFNWTDYSAECCRRHPCSHALYQIGCFNFNKIYEGNNISLTNPFHICVWLTTELLQILLFFINHEAPLAPGGINCQGLAWVSPAVLSFKEIWAQKRYCWVVEGHSARFYRKVDSFDGWRMIETEMTTAAIKNK